MKTANDALPEPLSYAQYVQYPPILTGVAATLAALLQQMDTAQWLPTEEILRRGHRQLAVLVEYAAKHSPYFRQKLAQSGGKLPILTRSDIQQAGEALHCAEIPKSHLPMSEGKSSGSTGEPVTVRKTNLNNLFWQANMMREHTWHRRDFSGRLLVIRSGIKETASQDGWGAPVNLLYKSGQTVGMPIHSDIRAILKVILDFKPEHINIYPSTLDGLITHCQKHHIAIGGVKHIWCISETLSATLRQKAKDFFGAHIEDDYSTNEIGIIALQCPESGLYHVMAESVLVEVVDENGNACAPGDIGKVLVTSLLNFATPLIRYEIGDYAQVGGACPCGRGLPTLHSIKGRTRNLVVKPDGSRHWPPLTVAVFMCGLPITQFQLIQHSLEDIEVRLVVDVPFTGEDERVFTEHLHKALDHPFPLRFVYFDDRLPLSPNGKFEDFICRI